MSFSDSVQSHDNPYVAALRMLWERSAYDRGFISNPFAGDNEAAAGLRRTATLLEALGRPQDRLDILHVAGSKGKGSTCAFAASILTASGRRTGLFTSPHLHSFRERMAVDSEPITESDFAARCERALVAVRSVEAVSPALGEITTFELATAMALDYFAAAGCDSAVVEVGLGGTLDATNVVEPAATLITALDFEHTRVLGSTIAEIASNKAGIIKSQKPVATSALVPEARLVVEAAVEKRQSNWLLAGRDWSWSGTWRSFEVRGPWGILKDLTSGLIGAHQVDNACLAIAGVWLMLGTGLSERAVREGLRRTIWPGRLEVLQRLDRTIILDGAHTPAAAEALGHAFKEEFPGQRCTIVLGVLKEKEPVAMARALEPIAQRFVTVTPPGPRGLAAEELSSRLLEAGIVSTSRPSIADALSNLTAPIALVTGSLSTVAAAREALGLAIPDPSFAP